MDINEQSKRLAKLFSYQILGYIALEILVLILIGINLIPPVLTVKDIGGVVIGINTGFIVLVGLIVVLTAASWIAILVEVAEILRIKKV